MESRSLADYTLQDYITELTARYEHISNLNKEAEFVKEGIMTKFCPVKIGDRVVSNGTAYNGKTIEVDEIDVELDNSVPVAFLCRGGVIKLDGTPGAWRAYHRIAIADLQK